MISLWYNSTLGFHTRPHTLMMTG